MIAATHPLSPLQEGMLSQSLRAPRSGVEIWQVLVTLREELDPALLRRSIEILVARHPALRTGFRWQGVEQPTQEVHEGVRVRWREHDWRELESAARHEHREDHLWRDRERGFQLDRPPLLRFVLFRLEDAVWELLITVHHAVVDGRSVPVFFNDLFEIYAALGRGEPPKLPEPVGFGVYVEHLASLGSDQAETYWRDALRGFDSPTPLGVEREAESAGSADTANTADTARAEGHLELDRRLSADATRRLVELAEERGLSLNAVVQSVWAVLLGRYSGRRRVIFGAIKSCRAALPKGRFIVGPMINTVAIPARLESETTAAELCGQLRRHWKALRELEHVPLSKVLDWSEMAPGEPLFESLLLFENFHWPSALPAILGDDWRRRSVELRRQPDHLLTVYAFKAPRLLLKMIYDQERFDGTGIARRLGHLRVLLESLVEDPDRRLDELAVLTPAERWQLVGEWDAPLDLAAARRIAVLLAEPAARPEPEPGEADREVLRQRWSALRARLLDSELRPVPLGVHGELFLAGAGPVEGLGPAVERFLPDPFAPEPGAWLCRTGERARRRADGGLDLLGRTDRLLLVRGRRVDPAEIETALAALPGVGEAVAAVLAETAGDAGVAAWAVPAAGASLDPATLAAGLAERLPAHLCPRSVQVIRLLPRRVNGELDVDALPRPGVPEPAPTAHVEPQGELERTIAEIWRDVLRVEKLGVHDNFFDLGGHSLALVQAHERLAERLGRNLSQVDLFEYPTVGALARALAGEAPRELPREAFRERAAARRAATQGRARRKRPEVEI